MPPEIEGSSMYIVLRRKLSSCQCINSSVTFFNVCIYQDKASCLHVNTSTVTDFLISRYIVEQSKLSSCHVNLSLTFFNLYSRTKQLVFMSMRKCITNFL